MKDKFKEFSGTFGFAASLVENFVTTQLMDKEQLDSNIKKIVEAIKERVSPYKVKVEVKTLDNFKGELPKYETELASGLDVRAQIDEEVIILPGERVLIPTGLSFAIPKGYEIQVRPRSGWALKKGISVPNTPGTIDADYRGELKVILINHGEEPVVIEDGDRVAQIVLCPVVQLDWVEVEELDSTERGAGGFGSTGKQ